jgi:hypothetical protein
MTDEEPDEIRFRLACWKTFDSEPEEAHDDLHKLLDALEQERAKVAQLWSLLDAVARGFVPSPINDAYLVVHLRGDELATLRGVLDATRPADVEMTRKESE